MMLKRMTYILVFLASFYANADVVKSSVSSKRISEIQQEAPVENPYVVDGLIGMWDGEWNVGFGKHNPIVNIWIDLSGNGQNIPLNVSHTEIQRNCIVFDGKGRGSQIVSPLPLTEVTTLEIVAKRETAYVHSSTRPFFCFGQTVYWRGEGTSQGGPVGFIIYDYTMSRDEMYCIPNVDTINFPVALSYVQKQTLTNEHYLNYIPYVNGQQSTYTRVYGYAASLGQNIYAGTTSTADGHTSIYTVRVYDRVLTESEIMHNYAIDKERFGLP